MQAPFFPNKAREPDVAADAPIDVHGSSSESLKTDIDGEPHDTGSDQRSSSCDSLGITATQMMDELKKANDLADLKKSSHVADSEEAAWKEAVNGFAARGAMASRFNRDKDGLMSEGYKSCKTHAAKQAFKSAWAASKLDSYMQTKVRKESIETIDSDKGTYMTEPAVMWEEGLRGVDKKMDAQARISGAEVIRRCRLLGGQWTRKGPMNGAEEFFYVKTSCAHIFSSAWTIFTEERSKEYDIPTNPEVKGADEKDGAKGDQKGDASSGQKAEAPEKKAASSIGQKGSKEKPEKKAADKGESSLAAAMKEATKVKAQFEHVVSRYATIMQAMSSDLSWSWISPEARPSLLQGIDTAKAKLDDSLCAFARYFFSTDTKRIRRETPPAQLETKCLALARDLGPLVKNVGSELDMLVRMTESRSKA